MEVPPQGHEAAALKPPAANGRGAWRGGGPGGASSSAAPPPKVYRVEPREFRDLVQRLTGAPPTALRRPQQHQHQLQHRSAAPVVHPQPVRAGGGGEQQAYGSAAAAAPWFSFPMAGGGVEAAQAQAQPQHGAFL